MLGCSSPARPLPTGMPGQGDTGKAAGTGAGGRPPESLGTPQCLEGACDRQGDSQALAIGFSRSKSAGCPVLFCTFLRGFLPLLLQHELVVAFLVCSIVPVHKLVLVLKGFYVLQSPRCSVAALGGGGIPQEAGLSITPLPFCAS